MRRLAKLVAGRSSEVDGNGHSLDYPNWLYSWYFGQVPHPRRRTRTSGLHPHDDLGVVGAFVATYLGQALGWYQAGEGAGLIGATLGAILILLVWGFIASRRRTP
jgi:uncharacterized membrane protein YeaQ/YmgE (transglycosylase-associated protein family)